MAQAGQRMRPRVPPTAAYHMKLRHQCGICGGIFAIDEKCVGLLGNAESTRVSLVTDPFLYIDYGRTDKHVSGWFLCRRPYCLHCAGCPEAATIHHDCFRAFLQRCMAKTPAALVPREVFDRLWRFAAWRAPWKQAPPLILREDDLNIFEGDAFGISASEYGMPALSRIPPELVQMIRRHSEEALLWRIVAAMALADRFGSMSSSSRISLPVSGVISWHRGGKLLTTTEGTIPALPIIRLAIDSHGIRSFERLSEDQRPPLRPSRPNSTCFVVEHWSHFADVLATIQDGLMRLGLPPMHQGLQVWDIASPPVSIFRDVTSQEMFRFVGPADGRSHFYTVRLGQVTGLTFFMRGGGLLHIHDHTAESPLAELPASCTSQRTMDFVCTIYVPLAAGDRLTAISVQQSSDGATRILLKTKLTGVVNVGTSSLGPMAPKQTIEHPSMLVYTRGETRGVSMIGVSSITEQPAQPISEMELDLPPSVQDAWIVHILERGQYFSCAKLDSVHTATVFFSGPSSDLCTGVMFQYKNGGRRAVGQCGPDSDGSKEYTDPSFICVEKTTSIRGYDVTTDQSKITFFGPHDCHKEADARCCRKMAGSLLYFWFSSESTHVQVVKAGEA